VPTAWIPSPHRRWLLSNVPSPAGAEMWCAVRLDGSRVVVRPRGNSDDVPLWTPDSKGWVAIGGGPNGSICAWSLTTPGERTIALPHSSGGYGRMLGWVGPDQILFGDWSEQRFDGEIVRVRGLGMGGGKWPSSPNFEPPGKLFHYRAPKGLLMDGSCVSSDGRRMLWAFERPHRRLPPLLEKLTGRLFWDRTEIWICNVDGSGMHEVVEDGGHRMEDPCYPGTEDLLLPIPKTAPFFPGFSDDGKSVWFLYQDALWKAPAK
jgi:hypothetical protein